MFDHAEVGGLVRVAELSDQAIFTREDRDDAAVDAAAFAHPLVHGRLPLQEMTWRIRPSPFRILSKRAQ